MAMGCSSIDAPIWVGADDLETRPAGLRPADDDPAAGFFGPRSTRLQQSADR